MDVEKLIERLKNYSIKDKALLNLQTVKDAAEALTALQSELEKVKAERDAAIKDLYIAEDCETCKSTECVPRGGNGKCRFKWRGKKEE